MNTPKSKEILFSEDKITDEKLIENPKILLKPSHPRKTSKKSLVTFKEDLKEDFIFASRNIPSRKVSRRLSAQSFVNYDFAEAYYKSNKERGSLIKQFSIRLDSNKRKRAIAAFLDSSFMIIVMLIATMFVLFASDIKLAALRTRVDYTFNVISLVCFGLFILEILLASYADEKYPFSFFFWLDLIATISIIQEIDWIFTPLLNLGEETNENFSGSTQSLAASAVTKATSAGRITRVLRVIRIIRLIRIVKLYKSAIQARKAIEEKKRIRLEKVEHQRKNSKSDDKFIKEVSRPLNDRDFNVLDDQDRMTLDLINRKRFLERETENEIKTVKMNKRLTEMEKEAMINNIKRKHHNTLIEVREVREIIKGSNNLKNPRLPYSSSLAGTMIDKKIEDVMQESKITKLISESITKKLLILILGMVLGLTILSENLYIVTDNYNYMILPKYFENKLLLEYDNYNNFLELQEAKKQNSTNSSDTLSIMLGYLEKDSDPLFPVVNITFFNSTLYVNKSLVDFDFRTDEVGYSLSQSKNTIVTYSLLYDTSFTALLNIFRTLFIMILVIFGAIVFENDAKELVLDPLEIMIEIVDMVAKDPICAKDVDNLQIGLKKLINKTANDELDEEDSDEDEEVTKVESKAMKKKIKKRELDAEKYEVKMIENAIVKISALLAICFGEAGGEIIKENLQAGRELNPMLEGKKQKAIFGFCDIRQFPDVNDALQEKTIMFVNQIAFIVHSSVDKFGGSTNKNIGDAFLSAWKLKKIKNGTVVKKSTKNVIVPSKKEVEEMADQAILGFLQVIISINTDKKIRHYRKDPDILAHPHLVNYTVKMGFGLHVGWGIEGAIGSTFKIDASYLSPNVNISARLEAATKQYGVHILISGDLYDLCSLEIKQICRMIDIVTVKGSVNPIKLYTIDVNTTKLKPEKGNMTLDPKTLRLKLKHEKEFIQQQADRFGSTAKYILGTKPFKDLLKLDRSKQFDGFFETAIYNYINGKWDLARNLFQHCLEIDPKDGPTKVILNYIKEFNFQPKLEGPDQWNGFRPLTSK